MSAATAPNPPADLLALANRPPGVAVGLATKARPKEGLPFAAPETPTQGEGGAPQTDPLQSYQSATCFVTVTDAISAQQRVTFANPDEAAQFKQMIDGLVGMFAMMMAQRPALARTLQTLKTEVAGGVVKVT
ncbi:MAG: hypothetical protein V2A58_02310, partial [Planctomycetota bacterium]